MDNPIQALEGETYQEYIDRILTSRPNKKISKSQQRHHILPKSRGGTNDEDNLIWLFASEHAKAHYLYSKEHPHDSGMAYAGDVLSHKYGELLSDEEINELAERNSKLQSERVSGEKNPMYGKHQSEEAKRINSEKNKGNTNWKNNIYFSHWIGGENHPRYGSHNSEEHKRKQSESMKRKTAGAKNGLAIPVKRVNTGEVFECQQYAANWCGMSKASDIKKSILQSNENFRYSAGKHPVTKEKLYWEFVEK